MKYWISVMALALLGCQQTPASDRPENAVGWQRVDALEQRVEAIEKHIEAEEAQKHEVAANGA